MKPQERSRLVVLYHLLQDVATDSKALLLTSPGDELESNSPVPGEGRSPNSPARRTSAVAVFVWDAHAAVRGENKKRDFTRGAL